jgi:hypothetical protein
MAIVSEFSNSTNITEKTLAAHRPRKDIVFVAQEPRGRWHWHRETPGSLYRSKESFATEERALEAAATVALTGNARLKVTPWQKQYIIYHWLERPEDDDAGDADNAGDDEQLGEEGFSPETADLLGAGILRLTEETGGDRPRIEGHDELQRGFDTEVAPIGLEPVIGRPFDNLVGEDHDVLTVVDGDVGVRFELRGRIEEPGVRLVRFVSGVVDDLEAIHREDAIVVVNARHDLDPFRVLLEGRRVEAVLIEDHDELAVAEPATLAGFVRAVADLRGSEVVTVVVVALVVPFMVVGQRRSPAAEQQQGRERRPQHPVPQTSWRGCNLRGHACPLVVRSVRNCTPSPRGSPNEPLAALNTRGTSARC